MQWKRQIPRGVPGILPLVRHRNHVGVVEMRPVGVAALETLAGRLRHTGIALEPAIDLVVIELFAPEQPGEGLPLYLACIF